MSETNIDILGSNKDLMKFIVWTTTINWRLSEIDIYGSHVSMIFTRPDLTGSCHIEVDLDEIDYNKLKKFIPHEEF